MSRSCLLNGMLAGLLVVSLGCGSKPDEDYKKFTPSEAKPLAEDHGHGQKGPNGGEIVELGDEDFHAEVVLNEKKGELSIYILGSDAKTAKPIEATELVLSFKHGDKSEDFKLLATKQEGDAEGQASLFFTADPKLLDELHEHAEDGAALTFTVGEKKLAGVIKHSH